MCKGWSSPARCGAWHAPPGDVSRKQDGNGITGCPLEYEHYRDHSEDCECYIERALLVREHPVIPNTALPMPCYYLTPMSNAMMQASGRGVQFSLLLIADTMV